MLLTLRQPWNQTFTWKINRSNFPSSYLKWLGRLLKSNITLPAMRVAEQTSEKLNANISKVITTVSLQLCPQANNYPIFRLLLQVKSSLIPPCSSLTDILCPCFNMLNPLNLFIYTFRLKGWQPHEPSSLKPKLQLYNQSTSYNQGGEKKSCIL